MPSDASSHSSDLTNAAKSSSPAMPTNDPLAPTIMTTGEAISSSWDLPITDDSKSIAQATDRKVAATADVEIPEMIVASTSDPTSGDDIDATAAPEPIHLVGTLPPGTVLGHFVVTKYIGGGGMGRVYLATDTSLDRKVAIKVLPRQRANDEGVVARFMNEARSAARLNHEHIAQVYFCGDHEGMPFIAFEYVEGTNIRSLVEEYGPFPIPQAVNFLIQIAHALAHADAHGVVHRDVKPSNILITSEGRAKLIDMGLARLLHTSESKKDLTASGVTLGTFDYISPEQARDPRNADIRSDIYSLGCTFFYMLTGRPPFPEGTVLQKLLQHQGDLPPDVREFQPDVPIDVAQLIQKMMAKDPRQRFQNPTSLITALTGIAETLGLKPTGPGRVIWVLRPPKKRSRLLEHLPWMLAIALLPISVFLLNLFWKEESSFEIPMIFPSGSPTEPTISPSPYSSPGSVTAASGVPSETFPDPRTASSTGTASVNPRSAFSTFEEHWNRFEIIHHLLVPNDSPTEIAVRIDAVTSKASHSAGGGVGILPLSFELHGAGSTLHQTSFSTWPITLTALQMRRQQTVASSGHSTTAESNRPLIVDPTGETPQSYRTFATALAAVPVSNSASRNKITIELRSNQPIPVAPTTFASRRLRIVAAADYTPTLLFPPPETGTPFPERAMVTVSDSELEFEGIAIEFHVPHEIAASRWTFFEILDTAKLSLTHCLLTIRNASVDHATYHQEVAFFRSIVPPLGLDAPGLEKRRPIEIGLTDSVLRGEAVVFHTEIERDVNLTFNNVFIATSRPVLSIIDPRVIAEGMTRINLELHHVSAYLLAPLIYQNRSSASGDTMRIEAFLENSLLQLNQNPLIDFRGISNMQAARKSLRWTEKGDVFLQEVPIVWKLKPLSANTFSYDIYPATWKQDSKASSQFDVVKLEQSPIPGSQAISRMQPSDMTIQPDISGTPAKAGVVIESLPGFPESE